MSEFNVDDHKEKFDQLNEIIQDRVQHHLLDACEKIIAIVESCRLKCKDITNDEIESYLNMYGVSIKDAIRSGPNTRINELMRLFANCERYTSLGCLQWAYSNYLRTYLENGMLVDISNEYLRYVFKDEARAFQDSLSRHFFERIEKNKK